MCFGQQLLAQSKPINLDEKYSKLSGINPLTYPAKVALPGACAAAERPQRQGH